MGNVFEAVRIIANNCESGYSNDSGKDYIDRETGFLYCGMCHTTKQTIVDFFGAEWDSAHFGDSNPYDELPKMNIFVYDLGKLLGNRYVELEDKAFNFHEFFRTWTGDIRRDFKPMPSDAKVGDFVHKDDVQSFLELITKEDAESQYPYSTDEYRNLFRHSLWMVPGVKEAHALRACFETKVLCAK